MSPLTVLLNGITIQHVGELIYSYPGESLCNYRATYEHCLEDFIFSYLCSDSVIVTGNLPAVGTRRPGEILVSDYPEFFRPIEEINKGVKAGKPDDLLKDTTLQSELTIPLIKFNSLFNKYPIIFTEWISREASAYFNKDPGDPSAREHWARLSEELPPESYEFAKSPPYMICPKLQSIIDPDVAVSLAATVLETVSRKNPSLRSEPMPTQSAVREFVTRAALTHVVIDRWYDGFLKLLRVSRELLSMPHITRALLQETSQPETDLLAPFVLADVLRGVAETPGSAQETLKPRLKALREDRSYVKAREVFAELAALDEDTKKHEVRLIHDEIERIKRARRLPANLIHWRWHFGKRSRYSVLFCDIVAPNVYNSDILLKVFPALNPMPLEHTTVIKNKIGEIIGPAYFVEGQYIIIGPNQITQEVSSAQLARLTRYIYDNSDQIKAELPQEQFQEVFRANDLVRDQLASKQPDKKVIAEAISSLRKIAENTPPHFSLPHSTSMLESEGARPKIGFRWALA